MTEQPDVITVLTAEGNQVDQWVAGLDVADWARPTPAPGWTIAHQIAHLSFVFKLAGLAASDPETFKVIAANSSGSDAAVPANRKMNDRWAIWCAIVQPGAGVGCAHPDASSPASHSST